MTTPLQPEGWEEWKDRFVSQFKMGLYPMVNGASYLVDILDFISQAREEAKAEGAKQQDALWLRGIVETGLLSEEQVKALTPKQDED